MNRADKRKTLRVVDQHLKNWESSDDHAGLREAIAALTYAERLDTIVGYMNHLGYVHCIDCAIGRDDDRNPKPPHPSWVPMRPPNLASFDDECDGCHKRLCDGIVP